MQGGLFKFWSLKFEIFQQILMENESLKYCKSNCWLNFTTQLSMQGGLFKFWSLKFEIFQQILMENESLKYCESNCG